KPEPLTVRVNSGPPAGVELGLSPLIAGGKAAGAVMLKGNAADDTPSGFTTVTFTAPALPIKPAGTVARSCVALPETVESGERFQCTLAPCAKPEPLTVRVNCAPPAGAVLGSSPLIAGGAATAGGLIVKLAGTDATLPG